jgi:polysaccharide biosynthesis/export protein
VELGATIWFILMKLLLVIASIALSAFGQAQTEALSGFSEREPRYVLQQADVIEIQYRYSPEYNQTVSVRPDGYVGLQLVGELKVGGLTVDQATELVRTRAAARLKDPVLTVLLKDYVKPYFVVAGEVNHPGRFDLRGNVTAMEAIAVSGGFKESAKHSTVLLVRRKDAEFADVRVVNMKKMSMAQGVAEDFSLRPGDLLVVPQNLLSKMERYIRWANLSAFGISLALD